MKKVELSRKAYVYPIPTVLIGANVDGKANFNTVGNCGIISVNPPTIYVSSHKPHYTNIGIKENQSLSVNIPSTKMIVETDYCGIASGSKVDKSSVFNTFYGKLGTVHRLMKFSHS